MKYIKEHIMFIFPMLAILLGIESFIVFDRMSQNYEQELKADYSMLVLANTDMDLAAFRQLDSSISAIESIEKRSIVEEMAQGMSGVSAEDIMQSLPHFYTVHLGNYLDTQAIDKIRNRLVASKEIKKVETFDKSHNASYNLFVFIKIVLWTFVGFMTLTSLFLVIKQMEIWQYSHKERMQVMEIFGAPLMLRSGVLFKVAIFDAFIATLFVSGIFFYVKFIWAAKSGIDLMMEKQDELFKVTDMGILLGAALLLVIIAVYTVVFSSKGVQE
jgi:cell division transport system permease protein